MTGKAGLKEWPSSVLSQAAGQGGTFSKDPYKPLHALGIGAHVKKVSTVLAKTVQYEQYENLILYFDLLHGSNSTIT